MGAEHANRAVGDFFDAVDEDHIAFAEVLDEVPVMNDLVKDINWRRIKVERSFNNINGTHYAGTESARLGQHNFFNGHQQFLPLTVAPAGVANQNRIATEV